MPTLRAEAERHPPKQNRLLAALPEEDYERLRPYLSLALLPLGKALYEPGAPLRHMYFPVAGVVSLLQITRQGGTAEIAVVGNDGCFGVEILLSSGTAPSRAVVQVAGYAYQASAEPVLAEFHRGAALQAMLLRYVQALMTQISQTAVCNRYHTVEQQLCRWLLLSLDRIDSNQIRMTQQLISTMLGVRRSGVTAAAGRLQESGLIDYRRGHITVPDRRKLEAHVCECYAVIQEETRRLLTSASSGAHRRGPAT